MHLLYSIKQIFIYLLQDGFVVRIFATSTEPVLQQELQLKLARKCLHACGISLFDLEKDLHIISKFSSLKVNNKPNNSNNKTETLSFPIFVFITCRKVQLHYKHVEKYKGFKTAKALFDSVIHTLILNHLSVYRTIHGFPVFSSSCIINIELFEAWTS